MLKITYPIIIPSVFLAAAVAYVVELDNTGRAWIALIAFTLPGLISIFLSHLCRSERKTLSYLLNGAGLLMFIVFAFLALRNSTDIFGFMSRKIVEYIVLVPWCVTSILILIAGTPLALRSRDRSGSKGTDKDVDQGLDLASIDQSLDKLAELSQRLQDAIGRETAEIADAIEGFRSILISQEKKLRKLLEEIAAAGGQAQPDEGIVRSPEIPKHNFREYLIGLLVGILSSALVEVLAAIVPKLIE